METTVPGKPLSLWLATTPDTRYPALTGKSQYDVAILGGGLAGLTAAYLLSKTGKTVAVIEAGHIASGVSGNTTAKITSLHTLIYKDLIDRFGEAKARLYGESNEWAIRFIEQTVGALAIDCDFERDAAFTYALTDETLKSVQDEVSAAQNLGLPAAFAESTPLPFATKGAVVFRDQARFHPRKYLLALATAAAGNGVAIFENSRATSVEEYETYCDVECEGGSVKAGSVLVLTHFPFHDKAMFFARLSPQRSYALVGRVSGPLPEGMFISADEPERSVRRARMDDTDVLIFGGEVHKTGQEDDTRTRYAAVAEWARQNFSVEEFLYHWSTQDNKTLDGVPYIGKESKGTKRVFMASGFDGWGMTGCTVAGKLLSDLVQDIDNPWAELYDPNRSEIKAAGHAVSENLNVAKHLIGDKIKGAEDLAPTNLAPGQALVVDWRSHKVAAYKDESGKLHAVSANCTHMGCTLHWNTAEKSWDCPCHGSRFDPDGAVLHGPAVTPLENLV
jgi:glycine/D-amino acid oxidase-like deaminating enzyme/nitrite reductase/ring-hydroxylating ferredoxin subunit